MSTPIVRGMNYQGTVDSSLRPKAVEDKIFKRSINKKLLFFMLNSLGKVKVDDYEFQQNEQDRDPGYVTVATLAGGLTITVSADDSKSLRVNQTLRKSHSLAYRVTAMDFDTYTATLSSVTGLVEGDKLAIGATAFTEASARPSPIVRVPVVAVNYVQTLRDTTQESDHSQNTYYYGGPRWHQNAEIMADEHAVSVDKELLFGVKESTTSGGLQLYRTGGLFNQIVTNVREFPGGVLTFRHALDLVATDTRLAESDTMWCLASNKGIALWIALAKANRMDVSTSETYGINITRIQVGSKFLKLIPIDHLNHTPQLENTQLIVDPALLEVVTVQNQKTKQRVWMLPNEVDGKTTETGTDADLKEIKTAFGLRLRKQAAHSIWTNVADVEE